MYQWISLYIYTTNDLISESLLFLLLEGAVLEISVQIKYAGIDWTLKHISNYIGNLLYEITDMKLWNGNISEETQGMHS